MEAVRDNDPSRQARVAMFQAIANAYGVGCPRFASHMMADAKTGSIKEPGKHLLDQQCSNLEAVNLQAAIIQYTDNKIDANTSATNSTPTKAKSPEASASAPTTTATPRSTTGTSKPSGERRRRPMKEAGLRCGYPNSIAGRRGPIRPAGLGSLATNLHGLENSTRKYTQYPQLYNL